MGISWHRGGLTAGPEHTTVAADADQDEGLGRAAAIRQLVGRRLAEHWPTALGRRRPSLAVATACGQGSG